MKLADHEIECISKLGSPFTAVHKWLDEFAGSPEYGMKHRKKRHHREGIEKTKKLFGINGGKAAEIHIVSDLKEEGWKKTDHFPENEEDYVKTGLF